jgi:CARDB
MEMNRFAATALAVVSGALLTFASVAVASPLPRAQLEGYSCERALDPPNRSVSVKAVTRPLAGTRHLAVKFELFERDAGSSTSESVVRAGDLGVWISPRNPTLGQLPGDVWVLDKSVVNLAAPARYHFRVSFRWTGAHGRVLGTAVRYSPVCVQRELRPDLLVKSIAVSTIAGEPSEALYTAVIANRGATGAGPFEVLFTPGDGSTPKSRIVGYLAAGNSRSESFTGPACQSADPPTVTVDATDEVDDYNRANNQLTAVCPAPSTS